MSDYNDQFSPGWVSPYEEGFEAGTRGADPRECPHKKMTVEFNDWQRGHKTGCDMTRFITEQDAIHG